MFSTYSFTVTERDRDWLLIAIENEIFKRTQSAAVYSMSRFFKQVTKKLLILYDKMKIKKKEGGIK
jgi:hypothetical protein